MPGLLRRAVVVFAFVLASVASASAECAWVLWFTSGPPGNTTISPVEAHRTREECVRADIRLTETRLEEFRKQNPSWLLRFTCLPDTVDPRV